MLYSSDKHDYELWHGIGDDPEQDDPEQGDAEQDDAEQGDSEQGDAEQGDSEQGDAKQGDAKQGDTEQGDAEQADTEQGDAKQGDAEQDDAEQADNGREQDGDGREQDNDDDPEQGDGVTGTTSTSGAESTLDVLSDRDDWPRWFVDAVDYLQSISMAKSWTTLLASIVKFERSLGFAGAVSDLINLLKVD